ncbi:MAG: CDP-diacylglycerol--glycerol-3-phosphate 3-phosphatidyltransferase [Micrococcales bacterium]
MSAVEPEQRAKSSPFNLPNAITVLRILLVPVVVALLFQAPSANSWQRWLAVTAFVVSIATDGVDGSIARRRGLITDLGTILAPIADKALIGAAFVSLSILGQIPWWITIAILVREFGITAYRLIVVRRRVLAASTGGKVKTVLQAVAVGFYLSPLATLWQPIEVIQYLVLLAAVVSTVSSGLQYVLLEIKAGRARSRS